MHGTKAQMLLEHPVFDLIRHHQSVKLAETSDPFPPAFNPHLNDGVEYRAVSACTGTDMANGKSMMAAYAFYNGIEDGFITLGTTVVESSSGNTGPEMEKIALELGLNMRLVLKQSMPPPKLDRARVLSSDRVHTELVTREGAHLAREIGKQPGFYNPDQYGRDWNPHAQATFVAPQVFRGNEDAAAAFVLGGSCGTPLGFKRYVEKVGLRTEVHMVVAVGHEDLSGGKNLHQLKSDVLHNVFAVFPEESILRAPRYQSNLLSWLSWPYVVKRERGLRFMFGQSFGATVFAAFDWVEARKKDGKLDSYRSPDGKVVVLTFGMDDYQGYTNIYLSELEDQVLGSPRSLPPLEELLKFDRTA